MSSTTDADDLGGVHLLQLDGEGAVLGLPGGEQVGGDVVEQPGLPPDRGEHPVPLGGGELVAVDGQGLRDAHQHADRVADLVRRGGDGPPEQLRLVAALRLEVDDLVLAAVAGR